MSGEFVRCRRCLLTLGVASRLTRHAGPFSSKLGLVAQGPDYASRVFRYGNRVLRETTLVGVPDHTALVRVLMLLRAKTVMALHVDGFNSATSSHEPVVRFLGIDVVPPMGIERLTSRPGIATAGADIRRVGNSPLTDHFKFRYQLLQPPFDVVRLLRRLEEQIHRCPDEWLFWHRYGCFGRGVRGALPHSPASEELAPCVVTSRVAVLFARRHHHKPGLVPVKDMRQYQACLDQPSVARFVVRNAGLGHATISDGLSAPTRRVSPVSR